MDIDSTILQNLVDRAKFASNHAYCPYSQFAVGAAILTDAGKIFDGCNIENASYGLTNCAERTAIFSAVSAGHREILAIAIYTPTDLATPPCGACRQVIFEFGRNCIVVSESAKGDRVKMTIGELLPGAFGPDSV